MNNFKKEFFNKSPLHNNGNEKPSRFLEKAKEAITKGVLNTAFPVASKFLPIGKKILNTVKSRIADNIEPYGYQTYGEANEAPKQPTERLLGALKGNPEQGSNAGGVNYAGKASIERKNLLNMMLDQDSTENVNPVSSFRPNNSKDEDAIYYSSPVTESYIKDSLKNDRNEFLEEFNFDENSSGNPSATAYFSNEKHGNVLGDYTMNMAEDEKGKYISYYDKWDLQPWKTRNKLVSSVTDLAQEVAGINPTELYGRVYY
tara:strand:+ start:600 stop:1376 length:777 start_codon:yes stop_codon:yes gene_type:complete